MSLVIPPGFGQASIEIRNDGDPDPWYVTLGVDLSDVGGDFSAAASSIGLSFAETIGLQLHTSSTVTGVNLLVGQDGPDRLVVRVNLNEPGQTSSAMLPQNCAALYDKGTARAGRRGKGRMFLPNVLKEAGVNNVGVIDSNDLADLQLQATAFLDILTGPAPLAQSTPMVLLHNTGPGSTVPDVVTSLRVQNVISTQRRRLR